MTEFRIRGGAPLVGEVSIPGSKNAALAVLSSVMVAKGETILQNMPRVRDVEIKLALLEKFGVKSHWSGPNELHIDASDLRFSEVGEDLVRPIRTSFYLVGPLLARLGKVTMPAPGGCKIGARPVDFHVRGLNLMGAKISLDHGIYQGQGGHLHGEEIYLDFPSAGATQHLMATATLAQGVTVIQNAATEPEVTALAAFLKKMGARIEGDGTSTVTIHGTESLTGCEFRIPEDRIQAGTYLLAGAITRGDVTVRGVMPEHQTALVNKLREAGAWADEGNDFVRVKVDRRLEGLRVKTMPYPGFPTDIQQPMASVLSLARGPSIIEETIYESRVGHISELNRMGGNLRIEGRATIIEGVDSFRGAIVEASDLRAGAALVLAGLAADGETRVRNIHFVDRGYEGLEEKLTALGGNITRVPLKESDAAQTASRAEIH